MNLELTALQDEYLDRKRAETKEEWEAQVKRFEGKLNIESLLRQGIEKGWSK